MLVAEAVKDRHLVAVAAVVAVVIHGFDSEKTWWSRLYYEMVKVSDKQASKGGRQEGKVKSNSMIEQHNRGFVMVDGGRLVVIAENKQKQTKDGFFE